MIFSQLEFFIFFGFVVLFLLCVKNLRVQHIFLLLASVYFYAYWDWRFAVFLCASTACDYFLGRKIEQSHSKAVRRSWLIASILLNLVVLCIFKYYNFFISSAQPIFQALGWHPGTLNLILPAGISFWTFQKLCYTIDVYRGEMKACNRFTDFAMYVMFFPQLVAGPIVRASDFLPQLESQRPITWLRAYEGFRLFVFGFFKKVFIADGVARFVDYSFTNADLLSGWTLWLAAISYSIQIYCDFSGYSDMAIGAARIIGYDFKINFNLPYVSTNITEFWRRWHISLSSWLKDYLYIPLGGNRKGHIRTYINLFITMLLGGLWHGANWTFVFWGGLHGLGLAIHKLYLELVGKKETRISKIVGWGLTMLLVQVGWVFFRAPNFSIAKTVLVSMFTLADGISYLAPTAFLSVGLMLIPHVLHALRKDSLMELPHTSIYSFYVLFLMMALSILYYPTDFQPFIYFQF